MEMLRLSRATHQLLEHWAEALGTACFGTTVAKMRDWVMP